MIPIFKCGFCGCDTQMHPPGEPVLEDFVDYRPYEKKEIIDGKLHVSSEILEVPMKRQVSKPLRRQNVFTGDIETIPVGVVKYGEGVKKAVHVQLKLGDETITKAVCEVCYKDNLETLCEAVWAVLEKMRSR